MSEGKLKKIEKGRLPWFYRLLLKFPVVGSIDSSPSVIFWCIVMPMFVGLEFFLNIFLLVFFPFPINIVLTAITPVVTLLVFIRVSLERFINWWNLAVAESGFKWDVEKSVEEYMALIKKKNK